MDQTRGPSDELLRRALEFAVAVAQAGQRVRPPLVTPPALRPFLRFQKLPGTALATVRQAVDDDADFRTRLASVVTEDVVGAAGMTWLKRPEGWEDELARLALEEASASERKEADRQERTATKRLDAAEQSAARARAELAAAADDVARERDKRQRVEARATELADRVRRLEAELDDTRREARKAKDQLAAATTALEDAAAATAAAARERADWAAERAQLAERLDGALQACVAAEGRRPRTAPASTAGPDVVGPAAVALREASAALTKLAGALGETASALAMERTIGTSAPVSSTSTAGRRARPARQPLSIPGGIYLDAPEAAAHLLRAPDVLLVVDGYNAAKTGWPDLDLAAQRDRLLDVLEDQVRRVGTRIHVVFDGAGIVGASSGRRLLHVTFSPAGVIADDVIRELVSELPSEQSVVVATSDQAVVASVRAMGANTIASAQLLAALAR